MMIFGSDPFFRSNRTRRTSFDVPFDRPGNWMGRDAVTHVRVTVYFQEEYACIIYNREHAGGYYAHFRPIERRFGYETTSTAHETWKQLVEEAPKFTRKRLLHLSGELQYQMEARKGWAWDVIKAFCARYKGALFDMPEQVLAIFGVDDRLPNEGHPMLEERKPWETPMSYTDGPAIPLPTRQEDDTPLDFSKGPPNQAFGTTTTRRSSTSTPGRCPPSRELSGPSGDMPGRTAWRNARREISSSRGRLGRTPSGRPGSGSPPPRGRTRRSSNDVTPTRNVPRRQRTGTSGAPACGSPR